MKERKAQVIASTRHPAIKPAENEKEKKKLQTPRAWLVLSSPLWLMLTITCRGFPWRLWRWSLGKPRRMLMPGRGQWTHLHSQALCIVISSSAIWYFDVITIRHHHQPATALVEETTANTHERPHGVHHIGFNSAAISSVQRPQLNRRELSPAITESSRGGSRPTNAPCHRR